MIRVLAIILSAIMLSANAGISLATHYCHGKAVRTAMTIGWGDIGCGMDDTEPPCSEDSRTNRIDAGKCCSNQFLQYNLKDQYEAPEAGTTINPTVLLLAIITGCHMEMASEGLQSFTSLAHYSPPNPEKDILLEVQSFLI